MVKKKDELQYHLIEDLEAADQVLTYLKRSNPRFVAFDIETDGVQEHNCKVIGISIAFDLFEGFYFVLSKWDNTLKRLVDVYSPEDELKLVSDLCETIYSYDLLMHNGVFDIAVMYHRYDIDLTEALYADTMLMKHTVDEERPFGLKEISEMIFGEEAKDEQLELAESVIKNGGKWNKTHKDIYMGDWDIVGKYAIKDTILTSKVFIELENELEYQGLLDFYYEKEVMPLYKKATIPMKLGGVFVDVPYFTALKKEIEDDIIRMTDEVFELIAPKIEPKVREILDKGIPTSKSGQFAERLLRYYNLPVPLNGKTGKPTLAKSALRKLEAEYPGEKVLEWLLWEHPKVEKEITEQEVNDLGEPLFDEMSGNPIMLTRTVLVDDPNVKGPKLPENVIYEIKKEMYVERNPDLPHVFNLASNPHLAWLLFTAYKQKPKKKSKKTGAPTVDKSSLEEYSDIDFVQIFSKLKKEEKLLATYVNPILEIQKDGWIYPSLQQWGTTSGRYSCGGGLNLQTLPRGDKRIKKGFIAPPGYKVVNADFAGLEPRIFSWVSGDSNLKRVWQQGLDLYSQIAIDVFGLTEYSANPKDDNFLKTVNPDMRDKAKIFTLAVPYGAEAGRISGLMGVSFDEAKKIIEQYLNAYPGLKNYMKNQEEDVMELGMVSTEFGRVRHLYEAKDLFEEYYTKLFNKKRMMADVGEQEGSEIYYKFRNLLNNAKNFPIQATAAHVCNAALIKLSDELAANKIDGWIALQVHDEITCIVREEQADKAAKLLQDSMEKNWVTAEIDIPILAEPKIADNFSDAK